MWVVGVGCWKAENLASPNSQSKPPNISKGQTFHKLNKNYKYFFTHIQRLELGEQLQCSAVPKSYSSK